MTHPGRPPVLSIEWGRGKYSMGRSAFSSSFLVAADLIEVCKTAEGVRNDPIHDRTKRRKAKKAGNGTDPFLTRS